ncbi:DEAD/DEAH box helicase [Embleya sp. NPDC059237]|uniref:DEAD/DEAH box helicase n=1 Tax=Embleya sp. NPDC059237 TaxID=3346784 RepID=UPI0036861AF2
MGSAEPAAGAPAGGRRAREVLAAAEALYTAARTVTADQAGALDAVRSALSPLRAELVAAALARIPIDQLREATDGRLRLGALEAAGFATVGAVYDAPPYRLRQVPGVGEQTAAQAVGAARRIARAVEDTVTVRIDPDRPTEQTTALVRALYTLVAADPEARRTAAIAEDLTGRLVAPRTAAGPGRSRLRMWFARTDKRERVAAALAELHTLISDAAERELPLLFAQASTDLLRVPGSDFEAWCDFEQRPADYYALLDTIAGRVPDRDAAEGFIPAEIAERVNAQPLDESLLLASLRGYQSFGARFALRQRRSILGDEMGLGKTVQAIAALAHLAAGGHHRFLVVCPSSVLINWEREVRKHSKLRPIVVHGRTRVEAFGHWQESGGVAITTFDGLKTLPAPTAEAAVGMLVVDEAHYVKNPDTGRSRALAGWTEHAGHVLFLTGTPMENRVAEFRSLVQRLQPDLVPGIHGRDALAGSRAFRMAVAPAYLRRNQEDVLTELPALLRVEEWEEFSAADRNAYRDAVAAGNFMRMRRAAYVCADDSAKLERLRELVSEAAEIDLKVVVFSFFRDVLATVGAALDGPRCFGPITGAVAAAHRQKMVDEFSAVSGHAVLLAQIQAGGVGLNLQAASVVVICEPQVKPTTEQQAEARVNRMGQVRAVQVHRLLSPDSVDQRMLDILAEKSALFDAYARRSDLAEASPDAVDVSDETTVRRIVEDEQRRWGATG